LIGPPLSAGRTWRFTTRLRMLWRGEHLQRWSAVTCFADEESPDWTNPKTACGTVFSEMHHDLQQKGAALLADVAGRRPGRLNCDR